MQDSADEAVRYLGEVTGDVGPASSPERRRAYAEGAPAMPGGYTPREWLDSGYLMKADTLGELANRCAIPAGALEQTVDRFNGFARTGRDLDFGRGDTVYDNYFGDPRNTPNPNLGALEHPPYYAVKLYPGDVGTAGGLLTDEHGHVLDGNGRPIPGLWACGNTAASSMGSAYPGDGVSLGQSSVFGFVAAESITEAAVRG